MAINEESKCDNSIQCFSTCYTYFNENEVKLFIKFIASCVVIRIIIFSENLVCQG